MSGKVKVTTIYLIVPVGVTLTDVVRDALEGLDVRELRETVERLDEQGPFTVRDGPLRKFLRQEVGYLWWPRLGVDAFVKWREAVEAREAINGIQPEGKVRVLTVKPPHILPAYRAALAALA